MSRVSCHSGKKGSKGVYNVRHNDRTADCQDGHIDAMRSSHNRYINYAGKGDFIEGEREYYKRTFSKFCNERNARYKRHGIKRCGTTEDYRKSSRSCPTETILQIGNMQTMKDLRYCLSANELDELMRRLLIKAFKHFMRALSKYERNHTILNCALHMDEAGCPHLHMRSCLHYYDESVSAEKISANKALECMGFERPDLSRPEGRYNNRLISFSSFQRETWIECLKKALEEIQAKYPQYNKAIEILSDIELDPLSSQKTIDKNEYIIEHQNAEIEKQKLTLEYLNEFNQYVKECEEEFEREEVVRTR